MEDYYLTAEGVEQVRRILCVIGTPDEAINDSSGMEHPELNYTPMLCDLLPILLHFLNPPDAYVVIHRMLATKGDSKYLTPGKKGT